MSSGEDSDGSAEVSDSLSLGKLFLNECYAACALRFGAGAAGRTLRLDVSTAACTDHDLTGQLTWPGARLLCRWLAAQSDAFFSECDACELGAGTGLAGLLYAARGGGVTLTDHHPVVMKLLRRNARVAAIAVEEAAAEAAAAAAQAAADAAQPCDADAPPSSPPPPPPAGRVAVARLPWGRAAAGEALLDATPQRRGFRRLLGADILYPGSQRALPGLMASISQLLAPGGELLLCYCSRADTTDAALAEALAAAGLRSRVAPGGEAAAEGGVEGTVFRIIRAADDADA